MVLISIKDYAKQNNISYEAVRQQVVRYKSELEGHIIKDNRQQFLDEDAVLFLDSKREKNPIAIIQQDKDDTIKRLEEENKALLLKIASLHENLLQSKDMQLQLQSEIVEQKLLAAKTVEAETALTDARERLKTAEDIAEMNAQEAEKEKVAADAARAEAEELKKEIERLKNRNLFQRIFNKT